MDDYREPRGGAFIRDPKTGALTRDPAFEQAIPDDEKPAPDGPENTDAESGETKTKRKG